MKSCRRKNKYFVQLLRKYRALPASKRSNCFQLMKRNAKTFWEWSWIYQLGGNATRTDALEYMKNTFLDERDPDSQAIHSQAIQMNILEMFELITDEDEREEILAEFLKYSQDKDDLLFVMAMSGGEQHFDARKMARHYYSSDGRLNRAVSYKEARIGKMWEENPFMEDKLEYRY